jgi:alpha-beta hydrolase superfamily lysophospholipase
MIQWRVGTAIRPIGSGGWTICRPLPFVRKQQETLKWSALGLISRVRVPHLLGMKLLGVGPSGDPGYNARWRASQDRVAEGYRGRYFIEASSLGHEVWRNAKNLQVPLLALEGGKDNVVAPEPADKRDMAGWLDGQTSRWQRLRASH